MGIKSLLTSLSLALLLAPALDAQKRSDPVRFRAADHWSSGRSSSYQQIRPTYSSGRSTSGYGQPESCAPAPVWIPDRYEWVSERTWVPERYERIWVDPVYAWSFDACGLRIRICTQAGYWDRVCRPGYFATQSVKRWVPGHWKLR